MTEDLLGDGGEKFCGRMSSVGLTSVRGSGAIGEYEDKSNLMLLPKEAPTKRDDWSCGYLEKVEGRNRLCIPNDQALREKVMKEAIVSFHLLIHPCSTKNPVGDPVWKCGRISHGFRYWFASTQKKHDAIWVVVDLLTVCLFLTHSEELWY
ncbi:hypothetical protein Tco_1211104 [Tanacetum coccineum]